MKENILAIAEVPHMAQQWDFSRNLEDFTQISAKERKRPFHWKCGKCGYEWEATPFTRYKSTGECPCCEQNRVVVKGINDLLTLHPEADASYDFEANKSVDIYSLSPGSKTCLSWHCKKCGYRWEAAVRTRTRAKFKCPCCQSNKVIRKGVNDVFTLVPELKDIYDFEKNIDSYIYSQGLDSRELFFWKCPECGRSWQSSVTARIKKIDGKYVAIKCPHYNTVKHRKTDVSSASEQKPSGKYDLSSSVPKTRNKGDAEVSKKILPVSAVPKLVRFWDFEKNRFLGLDINAVSAYADTNARWRCRSCGYEWQASIRGRNHSPDKCPCCESGKAISTGFNDALTLVPDLAKIYDFEKNGHIDIRSLGPFSHRTANFKCPDCGYEWASAISSRVKKKADGSFHVLVCPVCSNKKFREQSYAEQYPELARMFNEKLSKCSLSSVRSKDAGTLKFWWDCAVCGRPFQSRLQSMIASLNAKTKGCPYCSNTKLAEGQSFAELHPDIMDEYSNENTLDPYKVFPYDKRRVKWVCRTDPNHTWEASFALRHQGGGSCPICNRTQLVKGVNTFADVYPDYVSWWSPDNERSPDETFYNSSLWFRWICPDCKGEYGARIPDVVGKEDSCPYCSNRLVLPGFNSIAVKYPEISKLWSPNNEHSADEVLYTTIGPFKWVCPNCKGEYNAFTRDMISGDSSCPYCNDRMVLPGFNSFDARHSDLMEEWDFVSNYLLTDPSLIGSRSITPVWWICSNNAAHKYTMTPARRVIYQKRRREPCPFCKGLRRKKRHFI